MKPQRSDRPLVSPVNMAPEERAPFLWASLFLFFVLASCYVLRPLQSNISRTTAFESSRAWLVAISVLLSLLASPLYGFLTTKFQRKHLISIIYLFFLSCLIFFWAVLSKTTGKHKLFLLHVFWVWVTVFTVFVVSVFWDLMVDLFRAEQGQRLFATVGILGTLGSLAGAGATLRWMQWLRNHTDVSHFTALLGSAALLLLGLLCMLRLHASAGKIPLATSEDVQRPPGKNSWSGIRDVVRSPMLRNLALFTLCLGMGTGFLFLRQQPIVRSVWPDKNSLEGTVYYAKLELLVNGVSLLVQLTLARPLLRRPRWSFLLLLLPIVFCAGMVVLQGLSVSQVTPTTLLIAATALHTLIRSGEFSVVKPARKILFTRFPRDDKYSAQSFIDTFVHRSADVVVVWLVDGTRRLFGSTHPLTTWIFAPVAVVWIAVASWLGRHETRRPRQSS